MRARQPNLYEITNRDEHWTGLGLDQDSKSLKKFRITTTFGLS